MTSVAPSTSSYRASPPPSQVSSSDASSADGSNGGFQDYMSAVVSTNAAPAQSSQAPVKASSQTNTATGATTASSSATTAASSASTVSDASASTADVVAALKKLGLSQSDIATALAKLRQSQTGTSKVGKSGKTDSPDAADAATQASALPNGAVVPVAGQPQLTALGFALDPISIATAAEQAIAAVTGQGATTGQTTTATATSAATATTATIATTADANTAAALLAQQGVVSVTGTVATSGTTAQATAASLQTIANQSGSPVSANSAQVAGEVATAAIQQATSNMPMSRMSEIRAKLQAAQLGASKTTGSSGSTTTAANPDGLETAAAGQTATVNNGLASLSQKLTAAVTAAQTGAGDATEKQSADQRDTTDQTSTDPSSLLDPSLAGVGQNQTSQTDVQQTTTTAQAAVPLAALASTLVSHAKAGDSEFNIRLDPAGLGQIDVKMKVSSDGEVRAHLIVDQPATLDLMMRDRQQLQQSLDQAGFKTDPSSLQFSLKDQGQGQNQGQQQSWQDQSSQSNSTATADAALTPLQSAVYSRQSYIRADAVDVSV